MAPLVIRLIRLLVILFCAEACIPAAFADTPARPILSAKIMHANTVYVDCVCPRTMAIARESALRELQSWGRFQISDDRRGADLVFLFSGNPYLGDYLTRDGPDTRPVMIKNTIMTVIDPTTGATMWTDKREWGSWRVGSATKDLINALRQQMDGQTKHWKLNDILLCAVSPVYGGFSLLTPEQALAQSNSATRTVSGTPDQLQMTSPAAPEFCKSVQFLFGSDHRIIGFQVVTTRSDDLNFSEILDRADQFNLTGGKYPGTDQVYVMAQSKDKKLKIQFDVEGHKSLLTKVSYYY